MTLTIARQARSFIVVGCIGFVVDGGILTLLNSVYDVELLQARIVSVSVAITVTWFLNRRRTFADRMDSHMVREWGRYAIVNGIGALLNLGIFFWLLHQFEVLTNKPLIPLAIAAGVTLIFNFLASRRIAFGYRRLRVNSNGPDDHPSHLHEYPGGENLEVMLEAKNLNRYLCNLVRRFSGNSQTALDFGAGIGTFSRCLAIPPEQIHCVEPDVSARRLLMEEGHVSHSDLSTVEDASIDYVFTLNVLEHVEDDAAALREIHRVVKPGGRLLIYVPAFAILFTSMDIHVGHYRRYRLRELQKLVERSGFQIEKSAYFDVLGFFATLAYKLFDVPEPAPLNPKVVAFYDRYIFPASHLLSFACAGFLGKNVYVAAHRPLSEHL